MDERQWINEANWPKSNPEDGEAPTRERLAEAMSRMEWRSVEQFRLRVSRYGVSGHGPLAPYNLVAVGCHWKNGEGELYAIDCGHQLVPVCVDFRPKA